MVVVLQVKKVLALIPARAGSKRLVGKNSKNLCGKPLVQWTIEAAKKARCIDDVIVSTDSELIEKLAKSLGVNVPFRRPEAIAGDTATCVDVALHMLNYLAAQGKYYSHIVLLQPTSPLRTSEDIDGAWLQMNEQKSDGIVSVSPCEHPPLWSNTLPASNDMSDFIKPLLSHRKSKQSLPLYFRLNGAICIASSLRFIKERNFYFDQGLQAYQMSPENSVDIDTHIDFKLAECLLKERL
jgi:N-acylneuraminate cytidylyltransferase